jgi:histidine phosphotransferase ChpT
MAAGAGADAPRREHLMSTLIDMRVLDLLSARLCHELISPVGAIANGVELLGEDDPDFVKEATALIAQSARKAGQRLQFYRFAYGALAGDAGGGSGGPDARDLVDGLLDGGKIACDWQAGGDVAAAWRKLACNLVVLAAEALPRGGAITVTAATGASPALEIAAQGEATNLTAEGKEALALRTPVGELTSRTVHAYYTGLLARLLAASVAIDETATGRIVFRASA